jgi:DNA-binding transcriptional MerR regulator
VGETGMAEIKIPEQLTFRRREVMQLAKLDGRVLDYWESEFAAFVPLLNQSGEKYYTRRDVETILLIRQLLIVEKRDKESVHQALNGTGGPNGVPPAKPVRSKKDLMSGKTLHEMRRQLREILTLLDKNDKQ